jgi:hypothetical protein
VVDFEAALHINPQHQNAKKYLCETLIAVARNYEDDSKVGEGAIIRLRSSFFCVYCFCTSTKYIYIYIENHSVCPLVGIGTLPPLSRQRVCPEPKGGWGTLPCGRGGRGVPIPATGEKA